jgi:class 3 adenylate cyclase/CheY-like chemotaxis protein
MPTEPVTRLDDPPALSTIQTPTAVAPPAGHRVLVVEDTDDAREVLVRWVRQIGLDPIEASNGRQALDLLRASPFDLVLLDLTMPILSGLEVLTAMQADEELRRVPVIVISAISDYDVVAQCVALGADDFLFKPFNGTLLRARVTACLEKKALRDKERQILSVLQHEQLRVERLLLSIFPPDIARRLKQGEQSIAEYFDQATVLFTNVQEFPRLTEGRSPGEAVSILNTLYTEFDRLAEQHGAERIKTIGDTYMAAAGIPIRSPDHAAAAAELALQMQQTAARLKLGLREPVTLRIGMSSGPVVAAVIGTTKLGYDLWGATVTRASQMESLGVAGQIQLDHNTYRLLETQYLFEDRGGFYIQGEGEVNTYLLTGRRRKV